MSERTALSMLFEDIQSAEVKKTALSRRPYYDYHSMLYKDAVEAAAAELAAKDARIAELEAVLREIADPKNSHKRNGSVYIPDVVQDIARAALSAERLMPDVKVNKTRKRYIKIPF
jgi:hypothetical protein